MSKSLKVLTYNIYMRPPGINTHGDDFKDERLDEFAERIDEYDVICLQEMFGAFSSRRARLIARAHELGFKYVVTSPAVDLMSGFLVDGGCCILSKFRIVAQQTMTFEKGLHSDQLAAKGALHALIEIPIHVMGDSTALRVHVFTTHLQASYMSAEAAAYRAAHAVRMRQLAQLRTFMLACMSANAHHHHDHHQHDALLVGDVNINARPNTHDSVDDGRFTVSNQYKELLSALAAPSAYIVSDELATAAAARGECSHPCTLGDVKLVGNTVQPCETLITDQEDWLSRQW